MSMPPCDTCKHYHANKEGLHPLCGHGKTRNLNPVYNRQTGEPCGPEGKLHELEKEGK